jgi:hypothetical protein
MADLDDVRRIALSLPETTESTDSPQWGASVLNKGKHKGFAWVWAERVEPKKARVPNRGVIAVRIANQADKEAYIASNPDVFFTEPHYNGFPAILVRLAAIDLDELEELLTDGWRCLAPKALVQEFDEQQLGN